MPAPILGPNQIRRKNCLFLLFTILGVLVFIGVGAIALLSINLPSNLLAIAHNIPGLPASTTEAGIGVSKSNNEMIGLSDGRYAFDTSPDRADSSIKVQAAAMLQKKNTAGAASLWNQAVGKAGNDTSDAEALIYAEDQRVLDSHKPYVTLVVGTMLTGGSSGVGTGRDNLQGAYVAQKEYNDGLKLNGGLQVRLLIANAGGSPDNVPAVIQRIVAEAKSDKTIVGVMGWPFSSYAQVAIPLLTEAGIPMVSPSASADSLTGKSPLFFRVVPSNDSQAQAGANYAKYQLRARRVALFVDPQDAYSSSLANDFTNHFGAPIVTEKYTVQSGQQELPTLLGDALRANPDLIYFAGHADDLSVMLVNLPSSRPNLQVLGGDALYELNGYPSSARPGFNRLIFTAFAYPDEWNILGMGAQKPLFFSEYPADFSPANPNDPTKSYGFTRADDDAILSYDATFALLQGCNNILIGGKSTVTPQDLKDGLTQINSGHPIQGVSGQIAFDNGDPQNKAIVVLKVDNVGHITLLEENGIQGCFIIGHCG